MLNIAYYDCMPTTIRLRNNCFTFKVFVAHFEIVLLLIRKDHCELLEKLGLFVFQEQGEILYRLQCDEKKITKRCKIKEANI